MYKGQEALKQPILLNYILKVITNNGKQFLEHNFLKMKQIFL